MRDRKQVFAVMSLAVLVVIASWLIVGCAKTPQLPETPVKAVTNTYHGVDVIDNYQWLENGEDLEVRQWTDAQNAYARSFLDGLADRAAIAERLGVLYGQSSASYYYFTYQNDILFALKDQPPLEQPMLVKLESPMDPIGEKVVFDPNVFDTTGTTSIDFYVPSPDAKLVAVSLSQGGTEIGDVHVFEVATGKKLDDHVPMVNTAGGDVAWTPDGKGFYYTHYPRPGERPEDEMWFYQQVYFHKLGTPTDDDTYVIGEEFPSIAEIEFETSEDNRYVLAIVANGDGGEYGHYLMDPSGKWTQITQFSDLITDARFGPDKALYLLSTMDAPRGKILRLPLGKTKLSGAKTIIPESEAVIRSFEPTASMLYVRDLVGGPSQIRVFDLKGKLQGMVPLRPVSAVWGITSLGKDKIIYTNSSYLEPSASFTFEPGQEEAVRTALFVTSPADYSDVEVMREFAISKDGTRVPLSVIRRKGTKLDGTNPTILYGYGGYGSSQSPWFDRTLSLWLDNGGVYAIANLRGGGEFGEEWHKAGYLTEKQNVFDDFAACAQHLIDTGYTKPSLLAIRGGSNGGLLVGATMAQHPELFRAVVCQRGVLDMLRVELDPNGAFNVTEYGTVTNPDHFQALYAYSPYHNVKDGVAYPDVLFTADDNDGRVNPSNSRKMAARIQAATGGKTYALLRMSTGRGHGKGSSLSASIAAKADVWAFMFDRLGLPFTSATPE